MFRNYLLYFFLFLAVLSYGCSKDCGDGGGYRAYLYPSNPVVTPTPPVPAVFDLQGIVTDIRTGAPIADAAVEVGDAAAQRKFTATAATDSSGRYVFTDVPAGNYDVMFTKYGSGYRNVEKPITVSGDTELDAQMMECLFNECYGGTGNEQAGQMIEMRNGNFAILGYSQSVNEDLNAKRISTTPAADTDIWLLVVDPCADSRDEGILFNQCYGGTGKDEAFGMIETSDNCLAITGSTRSWDGDVAGLRIVEPGVGTSDDDLWLLKIDPSKEDQNKGIVYSECFGGSLSDVGYDLSEDSPGVFVVAGYTWSFDHDLDGKRLATHHNAAWVLRLEIAAADRESRILFNEVYGGDSYDYFRQVMKLKEGPYAGNYVFGGYTISVTDDLAGKRRGSGADDDCWVMVLNVTAADRASSILFNECYGGTKHDYVRSITEITGGRIAFVGSTMSVDGDLAATSRRGTETDSDMWLVVLDLTAADRASGIAFSQCYGGTKNDDGRGVSEMYDGTLGIIGNTLSMDGDLQALRENTAYNDVWMMKIDVSSPDREAGMVLSMSYGGNNGHEGEGEDPQDDPEDGSNVGLYMIVTDDQCIGLIGTAKSTNGDLTGKRRGTNTDSDIWILKVNDAGRYSI